MTTTPITDALFEQVALCCDLHGHENVVTFVSRPMWKAMLKESPYDFSMLVDKTDVRIADTKAVVFPSSKMISFSRLA